MIVDGKGDIFENRRKSKDRREKQVKVENDRRKSERRSNKTKQK